MAATCELGWTDNAMEWTGMTMSSSLANAVDRLAWRKTSVSSVLVSTDDCSGKLTNDDEINQISLFPLAGSLFYIILVNISHQNSLSLR